MTWGEFKATVEAQGVQDSDGIWYIDVCLIGDKPDIQVVGNDDIGVAISD